MFLLVCIHVGDKHMWQAKQSCHWWDCNAKGACASMPMLAPRALNYLLTAASRIGHWQGQKPAPSTRRAQPSEQLRHAAMLSLQRRGTARKQAEDVLSHQESGTPRGTMTKLPIMLLQVNKSSLTGVHMQESVLEDRFGIVHHICAS